MGLMTREEYIESLRQMKPTAYMFGEKVTNVVDNPRLRAGIEAHRVTIFRESDVESKKKVAKRLAGIED